MPQVPERSHEMRSERSLRLAFEYFSKIAGEHDVDRLLLLMADMARSLVECERCTLWLVDAEAGQLYTRVAQDVEPLRMPVDRGAVGECIRERRPLTVNDPSHCPWFNAEIDRSTGYVTRNILVIPIFDSSDEVLGVYQALNKLGDGAGFAEADVRLLSMAATYSGKSLETAVLLREVERTQNELVHMLGEAGESRSHETGNHVKRVGEFCYVLARAMGLPVKDCDMIRLAAPLHDIGKVGVPDAVLNKPGALDENEYEKMKRHTVTGEALLLKSKGEIFRVASQIAGCHHEKFDGTGYPHGYKGEEIPLFARICALADVYDALTADRCYKKGWPVERVEKLFREESGRHFDPRVVEAYFRCKDEFPRVARKFTDDEGAAAG